MNVILNYMLQNIISLKQNKHVKQQLHKPTFDAPRTMDWFDVVIIWWVWIIHVHIYHVDFLPTLFPHTVHIHSYSLLFKNNNAPINRLCIIIQLLYVEVELFLGLAHTWADAQQRSFGVSTCRMWFLKRLNLRSSVQCILYVNGKSGDHVLRNRTKPGEWWMYQIIILYTPCRCRTWRTDYGRACVGIYVRSQTTMAKLIDYNIGCFRVVSVGSCVYCVLYGKGMLCSGSDLVSHITNY